MRVAVRVDAGPLIGGGHAMRCLTLADALASQGAHVLFVSAVMPASIEERITAAGHELVRIPASPELNRSGTDWHEPPLNDDAQLEDVTATGDAVGTVDWLIVDHYLLDAVWHSAARRFADRLLVIDDLANRQCDCNALLDQTFGRAPDDYRGLIPERAVVLAGSSYALLRPEFDRERPAALKRRQAPSTVGRVLVCIGTTDPQGITSGIVERVLGALDCAVDVVIGAQAESLQAIRELAANHRRVTIHIDTRDMARLMLDSDLAIGAAGTTSLERCCLGLPAIALILAENQRASAKALDATGAAIAIDSADAIDLAMEKLLADPDQLAQMSAAAFAIVDGLGTDRVVAALGNSISPVAPIVELRAAALEDFQALWLWRNDPVTRRQSRKTRAISWESHVRWMTAAFADSAWKILIAERNGTSVGNVGFHAIEDGASEVAIVVAPAERGYGIGRAMLNAACEQSPAQDLYASVRVDNEPSRRVFESCGFRPVESMEPGFVRYLRARVDRRRKLA